MAAQDFNFLLATDSYKVSEFGLMNIFWPIYVFAFYEIFEFSSALLLFRQACL